MRNARLEVPWFDFSHHHHRLSGVVAGEANKPLHDQQKKCSDATHSPAPAYRHTSDSTGEGWFNLMEHTHTA